MVLATPTIFLESCVLPGAGAAGHGDETLEGGRVQCHQRRGPHASFRLVGFRRTQQDIPPQVTHGLMNMLGMVVGLEDQEIRRAGLGT